MKRIPVFLQIALCAAFGFAIPSFPPGLDESLSKGMDFRLPGAGPLTRDQIRHGNLTGKDAWKAVLSLAESGMAGMQFAAGDVYRLGYAGVAERDPVKAFGWYRKAALQNHAPGILYLGCCYYGGQGTTRDYGQALFWFGKGAELKDPRCMNNLGQMYLNGTGTGQDRRKAYGCFADALDADPKLALTHLNLALCHHYGWGVDRDMGKAYPLFCYAANHGVADAQIHLVHYNMEGLGGIEKQPLKAYAWALVAKNSGHALGGRYAAWFEQHLNKDAQEKVRAEVAKWKPDDT